MEDNYQKSLKVMNRLVRKSAYQNAQIIAMYENQNDEVNTNFMLKIHAESEGKQVIIIDEINESVQADLYVIPISSFNESFEYESRVELVCSKKNI